VRGIGLPSGRMRGGDTMSKRCESASMSEGGSMRRMLCQDQCQIWDKERRWDRAIRGQVLNCF